jgi:hypothetical protein
LAAMLAVFSLKRLLRVRFIIETLKLIKGLLLRANEGLKEKKCRSFQQYNGKVAVMSITLYRIVTRTFQFTIIRFFLGVLSCK